MDENKSPEERAEVDKDCKFSDSDIANGVTSMLFIIVSPFAFAIIIESGLAVSYKVAWFLFLSMIIIISVLALIGSVYGNKKS